MENTKKILFGLGVLMVIMVSIAISGCLCKGQDEECSNDLECCEGLTCVGEYRNGTEYKECHSRSPENISV